MGIVRQAEKMIASDRGMAFVGVAQAARLVDMSARGVTFSESVRDATLFGIYVIDPTKVSEVFPDPNRFELGLQTAYAITARPDPSLMPSLRYVLSILELTHRLESKHALVQRLHRALDVLAGTEAPWSDPGQAAAVYQDTVSTLDRRIQVTGDPSRLQTPAVAEEIRALLLAGIRYAWLWRQLGGRRWHLVMRRSSIRRDLERQEGSIA